MVGIILAAGLGSRCKEITKKVHKALIEINGKPHIEENIEYLLENGVEKVYIVIGYLKEQFYYLKDKYENVELIENEYYREYNNIYSMYKALPYIDDGFILMEADVVIHKKIKLPIKNKKAVIGTMLRNEKSKEWFPRIGKNGYVEKVDITEEDSPCYIGLAYYSAEKVKLIKEEYKKYVNENMDYEKLGLYWDDVVIGIIEKLEIEVVEFPENTFTEIDNYDNYIDALKFSKIN